jgi:hypothetical protein
MSVKRIKVIYLLLLTMLFITSCSVNPVTGQNEFLLMSKQQESTLGEKIIVRLDKPKGVIIILTLNYRAMLRR